MDIQYLQSANQREISKIVDIFDILDVKRMAKVKWVKVYDLIKMVLFAKNYFSNRQDTNEVRTFPLSHSQVAHLLRQVITKMKQDLNSTLKSKTERIEDQLNKISR